MITTAVTLNIETNNEGELKETCEAISTLVSTLTHEELMMLGNVIDERPDILAKAREIRKEAMNKDIGFLDLVGYLRSFWKLIKGTDPG